MSQFASTVSKRLFSLDVFRGLTMFLLIAEAAGFHHNFVELTEGTAFSGLAIQLEHHPWNGLRFWDLIQPFFMFIVGVAMPFSMRKRLESGSRAAVTKHILRRCFLLFSFGVLLHCVYSEALVWELWNVLVQLAFTILIAYAIMNTSHKVQIGVSIGLLVLTEILYRAYNPGSPYAQGHESFGSFVDMLVMGKINNGYWVFVNFIPTAAHTIWGVVCGQILLSHRSAQEKLKPFIIWGSVILVTGLCDGPAEHYPDHQAHRNLFLYLGFRGHHHSYLVVVLLVDRCEGQPQKMAENIFRSGHQFDFHLPLC